MPLGALHEFPRLALATAASGPEPSLVSLAMLAGLTERRCRVQYFQTRACLMATEAVGQVTGLPGRHLDAWLMPPSVCRRLFVRAAYSAELAVVEGTLGEVVSGLTCSDDDRPGDLGPIAAALNLPIVAVMSFRERSGDLFHLPRLPEGADAVFIDELADPAALPRLSRLIRLAYGVPVIGALEIMPEIRGLVENVPRDCRLTDEMIARLAHAFWKHADVAAIGELARRPLPDAADSADCFGRDCSRPGFRVAYAHDEAFGGYFPDTLEALESLGADLIEFSPLRDGALPDDVDLALIGCGFPDRHAEMLASNLSMISALRGHVCHGRRIYSEGGGTAYLGRRMIIGDRQYPGAGILPFEARLLSDPASPSPVTRTLLHDCWLGPRGTVVRGYKSNRWALTPTIEQFECPACFGALSAEGDWFYHHHAVGSLIHLHLGALPEVVNAFAGPHSPSLKRPSSRRHAGAGLDAGLDHDDDQEAAD